MQPGQLEQAILLIRGPRALLDRDLAVVYDLEIQGIGIVIHRCTWN